MKKCPKCSSADIYGPHYEKIIFREECLKYRCRNCGYEGRSPTHDSKKLKNDDLAERCERVTNLPSGNP